MKTVMDISDRTPGDSADPVAAKRERILHGPIVPTLLGLTLPVLSVIAAQTFVTVLEAYWVSRLGTAAVAGVSLVLPLLILMNTMSNGGIGGGVSSAVSRAIGSGRTGDADALVMHALIIAAAFGLAFMTGAAFFGRDIFTALGGRDEALSDALTYSAWVFGGAPIIWIVNLLASAMRGAGEVKLPATVNIAGVVFLIPLSPLLIFGIGPFPRLGVGGAGAATMLFYGAALLIYLRHLIRGSGMLKLRLAKPARTHFSAIMKVGLLSALGTLVASLTVVGMTGAVGRSGATALAAYGIASRIDSLLVPLLFGVGSGVVTMVGVAIGAGQHARAKRVGLTATGMAFVATQAVGLLLALFPHLWMSLFSSSAAVVALGSSYFHIVAPSYGFLGVSMMLYFVSQGRSRMRWPLAGGVIRFAVTVGAAWIFADNGAPLAWVFAAASAGTAIFGLINFGGLLIDTGREGRTEPAVSAPLRLAIAA
jgi:putative MATE family efflux protein